MAEGQVDRHLFVILEHHTLTSETPTAQIRPYMVPVEIRWNCLYVDTIVWRE